MSRRGRPPYPDILTPRESEVLDLLREGLTNEQIAERLGISHDGAKYHVSEILSKLGVASREEAATWQPAARPWWAAGLAMLGWPLQRLAPFGVAKLAGATTLVVAAAGTGVLVWAVVVTGGPGEGDGDGLLPIDKGGELTLAYANASAGVWLVNADGAERQELFAGDCRSPTQLDWDPTGERIVCFMPSDEPSRQPFVIYSVNGEFVADGVANAGSFAWAPNGGWAFAWTDGDGQVNVNWSGIGGGLAFADWPVWGPNGELAVYRPPGSSIDGSPEPALNLRRSTRTGMETLPGDYRPLAWVLGGDAILLAKNYAAGGFAPEYQAYLLRPPPLDIAVDSSTIQDPDKREIIRVPPLDNGTQFWLSPDGSRAAFLNPDASARLALLDFETLNVTPIVGSTISYPSEFIPSGQVAFSRDGSRLYWADVQPGSGGSISTTIYSARRDGAGLTSTFTLPAAFVQFSADVEAIAYVVPGNPPTLWTAKVDGSDAREIGPVRDAFAWRPTP